ncbi:MAG: hypothetical protein DYG98_03130 [Haliscomenobacteraceae bacterium CHB4]|nr:hypothetical protein [Saprospiraceae bacterium]MCE7922024.1 hypothetical protein [Haliscomenobacteraceae bacterium CHB4]
MKSSLKYLLISILTVGLSTCFSSNAFAQQGKGQGQDKDKPAKQEKQKEHGKPEKAPKDASAEKGKAKPADDQDQPKKDEGAEMKKEKPEAPEEEKVKKEKEEKDDKGHAYGKDKGDLSGREFGQQRAAEARSKHQAKKAEAMTSVEKGDATVISARDRIRNAREKLEKDKKAKRINEKQYVERKKKIDDAEQQTNELESKVKKAKTKMEGQ